MVNEQRERELGQYIPLHYHYCMLQDRERMTGFQRAIEYLTKPGARVLDLGAGTGVLSFFASVHASKVWSVEHNPELVAEARRILALNPHTECIEVIHGDAFEYLPPEPVDVVICEMLHVGLLREQQLSVLASFKERYTKRFGPTLPLFVPEAVTQSVQPVQHNFNFEGYYAPTVVFQNPMAEQPATRGLGNPTIYQQFLYTGEFPLTVEWSGEVAIVSEGMVNALRLITKNALAIVVDPPSTIDWWNQYLVVPLESEIQVKPGDTLHVSLSYEAGGRLSDLQLHAAHHTS